MPTTAIVLFRDADNTAPILDWLDGLPEQARDRCLARLELLRQDTI